jgi:hypothetical protein
VNSPSKLRKCFSGVLPRRLCSAGYRTSELDLKADSCTIKKFMGASLLPFRDTPQGYSFVQQHDKFTLFVYLYFTAKGLRFKINLGNVTVRSTAPHALHLHFDISAYALEIRAVHSPKSSPV